ncbi:terminase small subunit [Mammaliicoccus sciuri]|uniref:terminase small subunit n=1 Tax=Mammaliicoccus sciuri TaxID=1296 RepID=UPI00209EE7A3|nr:terminase small subunit [Mammaliicoccus sciuri]MCP1288321.1 terminase small subunit [Mammaliicoccus sciuri]
MKLTIKQQKFVDEYLISGNATDAAIKAGYSKKSARQVATENLSKPYISEYINERLQEVKNDKLMSIEEAMLISSSLARGEVQKAYTKIHDHLKDEVVKETTYNITPSVEERQRSIEHILKIHGAFNKGLSNKKIEKEIEMMNKKIEQMDRGDTAQEDKIKQLHDAITDVISND